MLITPSTPPLKLMPTPIGGLGTAAPGVCGVRPAPVKSSGRRKISSPGSEIWPGRPSGNRTERGCRSALVADAVGAAGIDHKRRQVVVVARQR